MAAETQISAVNKAEKPQDPNETLAAEPPNDLSQSNQPKENLTPPSDSTPPPTDLQKKMRRAERFGMTVQLSEEEKRNSRAERFGTGSNTKKSSELKKAEELKRKARAERFGLPTQSVTDEEAKKKARLARFAPVSKTDTVEDEKKKARAIRFSQEPSGASSEVNGKSDSVKENAIVGKAGGGT